MAHGVDRRHEAWFRFMRRGDFERAWRISDDLLDERFDSPAHLPRHLQAVWDGTPLAGKRVLVRCYHGLGDTIQFVRYAPLLRAIAAEVTLWVQPRLIPLLATATGIDRLLPLHEGHPQVDRDADVEIMELAHVFRTEIDTIPRDVPYLRVEPAPLERDGRLAVGLVWRSGRWDDRRSIPFPVLQPLGLVPGVELHILQDQPESEGWTSGFGVLSGAGSPREDARVIRALDLVISVDSMPAHLAGAVGVPVWTLLARESCWRWMEGREDSPWYPTMRLFRQQRSGEWEPVVERVAAELARLAEARAVSSSCEPA